MSRWRQSSSKGRYGSRACHFARTAFSSAIGIFPAPRSLTEAAKKAYAMAGIKDPKKEIDIVELYDAFTYQELMWLEEMGLADDAMAGKLLEKGEFNIDGRLPVNASGGLLSGHPVIAAGLYSMAAVVRQIRGDAGGFQVKEGENWPRARSERPGRPVPLRVYS